MTHRVTDLKTADVLTIGTDSELHEVEKLERNTGFTRCRSVNRIRRAPNCSRRMWFSSRRKSSFAACWWRLIQPVSAARRTCQGWMICATGGFPRANCASATL